MRNVTYLVIKDSNSIVVASEIKEGTVTPMTTSRVSKSDARKREDFLQREH